MKTLFIFLMLTGFCLTFGYSQTKEKIHIPLLKRSRLLDSLINFALKHEGAANIESKKISFQIM